MKTLITYLLSLGIFAASLILTSCATITSDIDIETHVDPDADFSTYKTYAWLGTAQIVFDPIGQWEQPTLDTDEEVKFNINRELRDRGLFEVTKQPDLIVAFAAGVDMTALELKEDPKSKKDILKNVPRASLVVALVDANTGYTVWLGYAEADVQEQQTIENIRARIEYAIAEIFKAYNQK